jgi:hypothetical protein
VDDWKGKTEIFPCATSRGQRQTRPRILTPTRFLDKGPCITLSWMPMSRLPTPRRPIPVSPRLQEALTDITNSQHALDEAHLELVNSVMRARALRASWGQIGASLGISQQAAHQRFRHDDPAVPATEPLS